MKRPGIVSQRTWVNNDCHNTFAGGMDRVDQSTFMVALHVFKIKTSDCARLADAT